MTGRLSIVGLGPGDLAMQTPQASAALAAATDLVGYLTYLDRVPHRPAVLQRAVPVLGVPAALLLGVWVAVGRGLAGAAGDLVLLYTLTLALPLTALLVVAGVLAVVTSPGIPGALAGAACWGLGASLGFPLGMSAAGDEESRAAARVSVVSSIGYTAFLGGPPLIGLLADHVTVRHAILAALGAAAVGFAFSVAARPLRPA